MLSVRKAEGHSENSSDLESPLLEVRLDLHEETTLNLKTRESFSTLKEEAVRPGVCAMLAAPIPRRERIPAPSFATDGTAE